jgi:hypothetical protein
MRHALLAFAVALCCGSGAVPEAAAEEKAPEFTLELEEDGTTFFVDLARTKYFEAFEIYSMVRFIPWRRVSKPGVEGRVRMSLGYGTGLAKGMRQQLGTDNALGFLFEAAEQWEERQYFQLDPKQIEEMLQLLDRLEKIEFAPPPAHVKWRVVELKWGDVQLRKADDGYWLFIPGEPGGWEPLPLPKFRALLKRAQADLKTLMEAAPSAKW